MIKSEFRRFFLNLRREMDVEEIEEISDKIFDKLIEKDLYKKAKTIFVYVAMDKEIQTQKIIEKALADGKEVYVPFIENSKMFANRLLNVDDLEEGKFSIKTSYSGINIKDPDLTLTPGLSFDRNKNRLGYGGGFYDSFIKNSKTTSLGLFAKVFESKNLPIEDHDIKLDYILTEEEFI